ncbi:heme ABC transporter ATP-binding protein [soil metagenome]
MMVARDVSVALGRTMILDAVSFRARKGELVAIVGPNGAGKSTLLRVLSGELAPNAGSVTLFGKPLAEQSSRVLARRRAVVPQSSEVAFAFAAYDVVLLGRSPHVERRETERDRALARLAMKTTDTLHLAETPYEVLSGGEKQRVQLARALTQIADVAEETLLLLDEPTSSLDLVHQHTLLGHVAALRERSAIVCILHDLNLAAQYADRIVVLDGGRVVADAAPRAVLSESLLATVFEVEASVLDHPHHAGPLVVPRTARPLDRTARRATGGTS